MKIITFLLFAFFLSPIVIAQSICGNLNSSTTNTTLGYGNVDIYQGDKLVASVLTDRMGNFNIPLDTGMYKCVVNYAGFEPITKDVHVTKDEKADFSIKEDSSKPKRTAKPKDEMRALEKAAFGTSSPTLSYSVTDSREMDEAIPYTGIFKPGTPQLGGVSGALTAGEINDFSKWNLWKDISATELQVFQSSWNISPKGRYTLNLQGKTGLPLADAVVTLKQSGTVIFTARTDNTGKAELWLTIKNETPNTSGKLSMDVSYQGKTTSIRSVKAFETTMNQLVLDVTCEQSENVDVAFVVDATGSMGDELSFLQAEMNEIIYQSKQISSKLNFRFANVFYRDLGANENYITQKMDFNRILSESINYINDQSAGGGGDYEEAVEIALDSAINGLSWSEEARARIVFLVLDAPPHNTPEIQAKLQRIILQSAEKGIRIVPIGASGINKSTEYLMRSLALGTNGTYTFLTDHSGVGNGHIAPSTDKFDVESLNALMVRILKSYTYMPDCEQNISDVAPEYPDSLVVYPIVQDSIDSTQVNNQPNGSDSLQIKWNYYPNPTNGIVNVTANRDIPELFITDLSGKVLQIISNITKDRTIQIDLSNYSTGIYLIRYPNGKSWISGKIVLQRTS